MSLTTICYDVNGRDFNNQVIGNPFTLGSGDTVSDAVLALGNYPVDNNNNPVSVYIESGNSGSPDSILAPLTQVGAVPLSFGGGGLVTFTCSGIACDLVAGNYWLVAVDTDRGTQQAWFWDYQDTNMPYAYDSDGSPTGLAVIASQTGAAFQIDGSPSGVTPKPSSFLLLGSGLLGLAGLLKRKRTD